MTAHEKYRMPEGVRVICGFPGIGKSMLTQQNLSFVDMDIPELKNDIPQYIERIRTALKIPGVTVLLPTWLNLRLGLWNEQIPFVLFYPSADLKADYHKRYSDRGSPQAMIDTMMKMWDVFLTTCWNDPTPHKVEMRQSQARLSDYFL